MSRILGIPLFLAIMYLMFVFTINIGGAFIDLFDLAGKALFVDGLGALLGALGVPGWLGTVLAEGIGGGVKNYLSYGGINLDDAYTTTFFPSGVIKNRDLANVEKLDETKITEEVTHAWYTDGPPLHPYDGTTEPNYTDYDQSGHVKADEKYTWCKAPRYDGLPYEVGPLARFIIGYATGDPKIKDLVASPLKATGLPAKVLFSTLGRTAARALAGPGRRIDRRIGRSLARLFVEEADRLRPVMLGDEARDRGRQSDRDPHAPAPAVHSPSARPASRSPRCPRRRSRASAPSPRAGALR